MMDNLKYFFLYVYLFFNSLTVFSQESTRDLVVSGVDAMMEGNYGKSLELLIKAKGQAEVEQDYTNLFVALNNIGLNYAKMLDNDEALEYYIKSYTIAIRELDASYEMTSLNNIAVLYSQDKNIDKAIEYFKKAYDLAKLPEDTVKKGIYSINLAQAYFDNGAFEMATPYIEEAIKLLNEDPDYLLEALAIKATLLNAQGQTLQAENLINELLPKLKGNRYAETRVVLLLTQAEIENSKGDSDRALSLCNEALKEQPINLETRYKIFSHINRFNSNSKNYYQALVAMDSMNNLKENIHDLRSGRQYQANRVKFEILNYETELADTQLRIATQRKIIIVIAISSTLIILLLIWSLRLSRIRSKQRKDLLDRQEKILNLELENEKANNLLLEKQLKEKETSLLLEQEQHKNEIESKNRKLSAKALYLIDRNRLVETIISD
jgi:tetratricopeptide (TPR) repeat protein